MMDHADQRCTGMADHVGHDLSRTLKWSMVAFEAALVVYDVDHQELALTQRGELCAVADDCGCAGIEVDGSDDCWMGRHEKVLGCRLRRRSGCQSSRQLGYRTLRKEGVKDV
jgi:hypothetical protein